MIRIVLENLSGQVFGLDDSFVTDVAYTKEEIDSKLTAVLRFKGTVATKSQLPLENLTRGDVWAVTQDNLEYVWLLDRSYATSVDEWEQLGPIHDLSAYYTKTEINNMLGTIPEGRTIMDLIGSDIPAGKSLKTLIDELATRTTTLETDVSVLDTRMSSAESTINSHDARISNAETEITALDTRMTSAESSITDHGTRLSTAEGNITSIQDRNTHADKKIAEIFRRVGDGEFKRPEEETYLEDKLYYSRNTDGEYKQLQWGTDYNFGDPIPENVYDRAAWSNISERMANTEGRVSSAEEGLQSLDSRVTTNEGNITDLQTDVTNVKTRLKDTLYAYNYNFTTSKLSDPFDAEKGHGECTMELLNAARANKAIRVVALNKTDPLGDQPVNFNFVNTKRETNRIIGTPLIGVAYTMYFYAHILNERLARLEVKYTWSEPAVGGDPMEPVLDSVTVTKFEFSYTAVTSEDAKPTTANKGDICVVKKTLGDDSIQYTGYVWNGSQWSAMDGNYDAESVIMPTNISLAGDYTAVGNIKMSDGTLSCKGWTVGKLFREIFNKTIKPQVRDTEKPTTSMSLTNTGAFEVGDSKDPTFTATFNMGKYYQPWNGGFQDDGTQASTYEIKDSNGRTATTSTGKLGTVNIVDDTSYKVSGRINYTAGTPGKDNTGATTDVVRPAGTTAWKDTNSITAFRYMYIGSIAEDKTVDEEVIKGLKKFTCGAVTKILKASGGDIPLVAGAVKVIVAIPTGTTKTACGGYGLTEVLLVSASNTPITSDYKAKPNVSVSGKIAAQNMKDYKVWVYQPASIDPGEVHSIKIS